MAHTAFHAQLNGEPADPDALQSLALVNYGHFTSMQVRDGAVRGLSLHLERLRTSTREMVGHDLDRERVRACVRNALGGPGASATVRVTVFSRSLDLAAPARPAAPDILVSVRPPHEADSTPLAVQSVQYERVLPHIKHVGTLGLFHHARQAQLNGYDDALFVTADGSISEGSIWNVGFFDGTRLVFPTAPALRGITIQLVCQGLDRLEIPWSQEDVRLDELARFTSAFAMNSISPAQPIAQIDQHRLKIDDALLKHLAAAYATNEWATV